MSDQVPPCEAGTTVRLDSPQDAVIRASLDEGTRITVTLIYLRWVLRPMPADVVDAAVLALVDCGELVVSTPGVWRLSGDAPVVAKPGACCGHTSRTLTRRRLARMTRVRQMGWMVDALTQLESASAADVARLVEKNVCTVRRWLAWAHDEGLVVRTDYGRQWPRWWGIDAAKLPAHPIAIALADGPLIGVDLCQRVGRSIRRIRTLVAQCDEVEVVGRGAGAGRPVLYGLVVR